MHPRTLSAVALAALLAVPAVAGAQAKRSTTSAKASRATPAASSSAPNLSVGGSLGYEFGNADGFALRLDGELPFQMLAPKVALSFVGSLGYTRFSENIPYGDVKTNLFKLVPAARFTMPVAPEVDLYGDGGLGLYHYSSTAKTNVPFLGTMEASTSGFGFMLRFGAGAFYKINPKVKLSAELGLSPYFGDVDTTDFTIMLGAMFAI